MLIGFSWLAGCTSEKKIEKIAIPNEWYDINGYIKIGDTGLVTILDESYTALETCDALILVTEWKQFRRPDFDKIKQTLKLPLIFDGRNQYNIFDLPTKGFEYYQIGKN